MGIGERLANIDKMKTENRALKEQLQRLDLLDKLTERFQQQQAWADKGAMQLTPGSEDPNVINPTIEPVKPPDSNKLLSALVPILAKANPEAAANISMKLNDPDRQFKQNIANFITGGGGLNQIISDMTGNDPTKATNAASMGTMLEMGGVPVFRGVERIQTGQARQLANTKYADEKAAGIEQKYTDPTGAEYVRYVSKVDKTPIVGPNTDPAGWIAVKAEPLERVEVANPDGSTSVTWVSKKGAKAGPSNLNPVDITLPKGATQADVDKVLAGVSKVGITTKQPTNKLPINNDELSLWVHPDTLTSPEPGVTPEQAKSMGMQRISTQAKQNIGSLKAASVVVGEIKTLMNEVFPKNESFASPQRLLRPIGAALQSNPQATRLFALVNGTLAPTVRSMGEKGNLSDLDIKRAQKLLVEGTDSAKVAWGKVNGLLELFGKIQQSTFSKAGLKAPSKTSNQRFQILEVK